MNGKRARNGQQKSHMFSQNIFLPHGQQKDVTSTEETSQEKEDIILTTLGEVKKEKNI